MNDLRIYGQALTAAQIQQIYHNAFGIKKGGNSFGPMEGCPGGTPGCVQASSASNLGSQTTSVTMANNVVSGNTLAIGIKWSSSTVTLSSISVSGGCAISAGFVLPTPRDGNNPSKYSNVSTAAIAYGVITTGGPCTITSNLSGSVISQFLTVHELNVGAYDCSSINHQDSPGTGSNAVTSLSCTTTKNGDYLLGEYFDMGANGGTWTAGTGFILETKSGTEGSQTEDKVQSSEGSVAATFTTSVAWAHPTTALMAFQPTMSLPNFTVSASPTSLSVAQGNQGTSTITTIVSGGFSSAISLSASGIPTATTVGFNPQTIPAPGSGQSTMTITVGAGTAVGTYPITVTGNGGGTQKSTTVTLTVTAGPNFTISALPTTLSIAQGNQGTSTITATVSGGFSNSISLSASGIPTGTTVGFNPQTIPAPGSGTSTMTITVGGGTLTGTYPITVTGNGGGTQKTTTVTLTVTAASTFTISASPSSLSVMQGNQGTSAITTTVSGGFSSAISLSASGVPTGTTVGFNPQTIPAPGAGNSTMTLTVGLNTPMGTYPITVTGNGGGIQQSVTVNLTVTAQVILTWTASPSSGIAGYNAYRSTISGGPYTKLNSSLIPTTNYNDLMVQNGYTYYYVTTAVNNQQEESTYSNESSATVP